MESRRAWGRSLLVAVAGWVGSTGLACDPGGGNGNAMQGGGEIPPALARFETSGPFQTETFQQTGFSFFVPAGSGPFPVATWGNGTASMPSFFQAFLTHIASHGIIVVAANDSNVGTGVELVQGLDLVEQLNRQSGSPLFGRSNGQTCAIGYSQGGGGALNAARDTRVFCSVAIAPEVRLTSRVDASGLSRVLLLGGAIDTIAPVGPNAQVLFGQLATPRTLGVLAGANHLEVLDDGGLFRGYATAFLLSHLRSDLVATGLFLGENSILTDPRYTSTQDF